MLVYLYFAVDLLFIRMYLLKCFYTSIRKFFIFYFLKDLTKKMYICSIF